MDIYARNVLARSIGARTQAPQSVSRIFPFTGRAGRWLPALAALQPCIARNWSHKTGARRTLRRANARKNACRKGRPVSGRRRSAVDCNQDIRGLDERATVAASAKSTSFRAAQLRIAVSVRPLGNWILTSLSMLPGMTAATTPASRLGALEWIDGAAGSHLPIRDLTHGSGLPDVASRSGDSMSARRRPAASTARGRSCRTARSSTVLRARVGHCARGRLRRCRLPYDGMKAHRA